MTTATLFWVCWGLVALGLILVVGAAIPLSGRVRPLRRALRRLSWRRAEVARLQSRAESVQDQIATLQAQATDLARRADLLRGGRP